MFLCIILHFPGSLMPNINIAGKSFYWARLIKWHFFTLLRKNYNEPL